MRASAGGVATGAGGRVGWESVGVLLEGFYSLLCAYRSLVSFCRSCFVGEFCLGGKSVQIHLVHRLSGDFFLSSRAGVKLGCRAPLLSRRFWSG